MGERIRLHDWVPDRRRKATQKCTRCPALRWFVVPADDWSGLPLGRGRWLYGRDAFTWFDGRIPCTIDALRVVDRG